MSKRYTDGSIIATPKIDYGKIVGASFHNGGWVYHVSHDEMKSDMSTTAEHSLVFHEDITILKGASFKEGS